MRKFVLCSLVAIGGLALTTEASSPKKNATLQAQTWSGQTHRPLRYAKVEVSRHTSFTRVIGPWIETGAERGQVGTCSTDIAFDAFDIDWVTDPNNPIIDPVGNRCGLPITSKYFFGAAANNPNSFDDMTVEAASNGANAYEVTLAINKESATQTYIVLALFEDVGDPNNCGIDSDGDGDLDFPGDNATSAWILDYGITGQAGAGYGQYLASLCADPDGWILPADGTGGKLTRVFQSGTDTDGDGFPDTFAFADFAPLTQPMLWFNENRDAAGTLLWDLPGTQTFLHWDDDTPFNGAFDLGDANGDGFVDECFGYIFGLTCPGFDPVVGGGQLGSAIYWASGGGGGGSPCLCPNANPTGGMDINADYSNNVIDIQDLGNLLGGFGIGTTCEQGDNDGDLDVDVGDLASLLSNFGITCN